MRGQEDGPRHTHLNFPAETADRGAGPSVYASAWKGKPGFQVLNGLARTYGKALSLGGPLATHDGVDKGAVSFWLVRAGRKENPGFLAQDLKQARRQAICQKFCHQELGEAGRMKGGETMRASAHLGKGKDLPG